MDTPLVAQCQSAVKLLSQVLWLGYPHHCVDTCMSAFLWKINKYFGIKVIICVFLPSSQDQQNWERGHFNYPSFCLSIHLSSKNDLGGGGLLNLNTDCMALGALWIWDPSCNVKGISEARPSLVHTLSTRNNSRSSIWLLSELNIIA